MRRGAVDDKVRDREPLVSPAGYSGTPLVRKLGLEPGHRMWLFDPPEGYDDLLGPLPDGAGPAAPADRDVDFLHVFATTREALERGLASARERMAQDGMVWLSWPKKSSGVTSELDGNVVRAIGLEAGLVDIKVCAVDETWSGLKFVIRLADRVGDA